MHLGLLFFLFSYVFYLGMQTHCVKSWSLTHGKLFMWPLTLLAETGSKEENSEICKGFHRETQGKEAPAACYVVSTKHVTQELWESQRRPGQQYLPQLGINMFPNFPRAAQFVFFHHTTLQR